MKLSSLLLSGLYFGMLFVTPLSAQIMQGHPELCGAPNTSIPVPSGLRVTSNVPPFGTTEAFLTTKFGERATKLPDSMEVEQACPLSGGRIVLFGIANPGLYNVVILNQSDGALLDSFYGFDAVMSPNQEWIVMRKFYPASARSTEEYLLYDLKQSRIENRPAGIVSTDMASVGRALYPLGQRNIYFDNIGLPEAQEHIFKSTTFFWSRDSQHVVFADSVQNAMSIVSITIEANEETTARVYRVDTRKICESSPVALDFTLSNVAFESPVNQPLQIEVELSSREGTECQKRSLILNGEDFTGAPVEVHTVRHGKPSILLPQ